MSEVSQQWTERLERLERTNKRLTRFGGAALGFVCVGWLASMTPVCKTVWAERFVLKDARGKERAVLTAYETGGTPKFSLLGERGQTLATLSVGDDGNAFLALFDAKGKKSQRFSVGGQGPTPEGAVDASEEEPDSVGMASR